VETLGQYLYNARTAKGIDLRDAAQQTRISIQYLKALEQEDFTKLPGEVFVRGFLKNYCRFLNLDESVVMKKYAELKPQPISPAAAQPSAEKPVVQEERKTRRETPLEPFVWGAVIAIALLVFLFRYLPPRPSAAIHPQAGGPAATAVVSQETASSQGIKPSKLYLEVVALEDTWLLVRTDDSPQKKAVLKRGDRLTWSAEERFLLSYGRLGAVSLILGGTELAVNGTKETVVRDLIVTRAGIVNQPAPIRQARPMKPKPVEQLQQALPGKPQIKEYQAKPPQQAISSEPPAPMVPAPAPSPSPSPLPTPTPAPAMPPATATPPAQ
jgi:transcriptional regulator with XRE-family HTH domain